MPSAAAELPSAADFFIVGAPERRLRGIWHRGHARRTARQRAATRERAIRRAFGPSL